MFVCGISQLSRSQVFLIQTDMHIKSWKDEPQRCVHSWHTLTLPSCCSLLPYLLKSSTLEDKQEAQKMEPFQIATYLKTTADDEA